jgi:micrococcal nuclease
MYCNTETILDSCRGFLVEAVIGIALGMCSPQLAHAQESEPAPVVVDVPEAALYHYRAEVASVYDGDTIRADINLGLEVWIKNTPLRLYGINTPEVRGVEKEAGYKARDRLKALLNGRSLIVRTFRDKKGKYGRWLATLLVKGKGEWCPRDKWCDANKQLVLEGQAAEAFY